MKSIKVGDVVRLRRGVFSPENAAPDKYPSATVRGILSEVSGGLVLDRPLRGFRYWNASDVQKIASAKKPAPAKKKG